MVGELLTLARLESGVPAFNIRFDLVELLRGVIDDARFEAASSAVQIVSGLPEAEIPFNGRPELLRRAFENIIRNAIRFSPADQSVRIGLLRHDGRLEITISDSGPGVPEALLDSMFEPFVRMQSDQAGFGLGLTIARRAIEAHGGHVCAKNGVGGGLDVQIMLAM
jgi:two-component system OmpR family sensor kinase